MNQKRCVLATLCILLTIVIVACRGSYREWKVNQMMVFLLDEKPAPGKGKSIEEFFPGDAVIELARDSNETTVSGKTGYWMRVRSASGKEGWVHSSELSERMSPEDIREYGLKRWKESPCVKLKGLRGPWRAEDEEKRLLLCMTPGADLDFNRESFEIKQVSVHENSFVISGSTFASEKEAPIRIDVENENRISVTVRGTAMVYTKQGVTREFPPWLQANWYSQSEPIRMKRRDEVSQIDFCGWPVKFKNYLAGQEWEGESASVYRVGGEGEAARLFVLSDTLDGGGETFVFRDNKLVALKVHPTYKPGVEMRSEPCK